MVSFACITFSSCGGQSSQNGVVASQPEDLTPQIQNNVPLSEAVAGWTMFDEDPNLANEFLQLGISSIKPGLVINEVKRGDNAYWSSVNFEICPELYTLSDIVKFGTGNLPKLSWVQGNGNFEVGKPTPNFEFEYRISVLEDTTVTSSSIVDGFNQFVARFGDTCEFVSDLWFLASDVRNSCVVEFVPGYLTSCLRQGASKFAPGKWGNFISKLVYSNSGSPSLFSVTTSIPYETSDGGYRRDVMARKLYVLPNSNDIFEVAVRMGTSDSMVTDDNWNEVVMGLTDLFFSYAYNSLLELNSSGISG